MTTLRFFRNIAIAGATVAGRYFNTAADWDDDPWEIACKNITPFQLNTNYGNAYARHLTRLQTKDSMQ